MLYTRAREKCSGGDVFHGIKRKGGKTMNKLELQKMANEVRKDIVAATHAAKSGHPGGSLSAADIFTYLYFAEMNVDPKDPKNPDRAIRLPDTILLWQREGSSPRRSC